MVKIQTFDAVTFWKNSYAHQRGKLLRKLNVTDEQIKELVNKPYVELSSALRYEIETCDVQKSDLTWYMLKVVLVYNMSLEQDDR